MITFPHSRLYRLLGPMLTSCFLENSTYFLKYPNTFPRFREGGRKGGENITYFLPEISSPLGQFPLQVGSHHCSYLASATPHSFLSDVFFYQTLRQTCWFLMSCHSSVVCTPSEVSLILLHIMEAGF